MRQIGKKCLTSSNEHVQVPCTGLKTDSAQHNGRTNPDGRPTSEAIGEVGSEGVGRQGTDVLAKTTQ